MKIPIPGKFAIGADGIRRPVMMEVDAAPSVAAPLVGDRPPTEEIQGANTTSPQKTRKPPKRKD